MRRPRVLVTLDESEVLRRGVPAKTVVTKRAYVDAVEAAGGIPLLVAPTGDADTIGALIEVMEALVVTGGNFDIDPSLSGADASLARSSNVGRTRFEWSLFEAALAKGVPVLGVCGGMQLMNVALGGTLFGDIQSEISGAIDHEQPNPVIEAGHAVSVVQGSRLAGLAEASEVPVNSTHHQAVRKLGRELTVSAYGPDGVIEAIEHSGGSIGIQWHPEHLDHPLTRALYGDIVRRARRGN